ncbi:MAG TPA: hypothetical protein VL460_00050 [Caulobacteraceae bacterium]|nr:hypothetical protein [Caulobacteraceae bacterium]
MNTVPPLAAALLLVAGGASAQSTSVTAGPGGTLNGSVSAPGAPPVNVQAGHGSVITDRWDGRGSSEASSSASASAGPGGAVTRAGPGRSLTVRSADGASSSSVSVSGAGPSVLAGAGSPGSRITTSPPAGARRGPAACPRDASRAYRARTHCRPAVLGRR